ncbi:unnamed protein product [Amoebophrya sp. A25]|nr:unnamed protein product [Amoebophrya sp. A25]|eukprot:GSA25T00018169001.1
MKTITGSKSTSVQASAPTGICRSSSPRRGRFATGSASTFASAHSYLANNGCPVASSLVKRVRLHHTRLSAEMLQQSESLSSLRGLFSEVQDLSFKLAGQTCTARWTFGNLAKVLPDAHAVFSLKENYHQQVVGAVRFLHKTAVVGGRSSCTPPGTTSSSEQDSTQGAGSSYYSDTTWADNILEEAGGSTKSRRDAIRKHSKSIMLQVVIDRVLKVDHTSAASFLSRYSAAVKESFDGESSTSLSNDFDAGTAASGGSGGAGAGGGPGTGHFEHQSEQASTSNDPASGKMAPRPISPGASASLGSGHLGRSTSTSTSSQQLVGSMEFEVIDDTFEDFLRFLDGRVSLSEPVFCYNPGDRVRVRMKLQQPSNPHSFAGGSRGTTAGSSALGGHGAASSTLPHFQAPSMEPVFLPFYPPSQLFPASGKEMEFYQNSPSSKMRSRAPAARQSTSRHNNNYRASTTAGGGPAGGGNMNYNYNTSRSSRAHMNMIMNSSRYSIASGGHLSSSMPELLPLDQWFSFAGALATREADVNHGGGTAGGEFVEVSIAGYSPEKGTYLIQLDNPDGTKFVEPPADDDDAKGGDALHGNEHDRDSNPASAGATSSSKNLGGQLNPASRAGVFSSGARLAFNPCFGNHCSGNSYHYRGGTQLLVFVKKKWLDAVVVYHHAHTNRHLVRISISSWASDAWAGKVNSSSSGAPPSSPGCSDEEAQEEQIRDVLLDLNSFNHCVAKQMTARGFEDEAHRLRTFMKARYGFIIDSISGAKLDLRVDCADFRLTEHGHQRENIFFSACESEFLPPMTSCATNVTTSEIGQQTWAPAEELADLLCVKNSDVDRSCGCSRPRAFLVRGPSGSGKSCLIRKLVVAILSEPGHELLPLLIPVTEFFARTQTSPSNLGGGGSGRESQSGASAPGSSASMSSPTNGEMPVGRLQSTRSGNDFAQPTKSVTPGGTGAPSSSSGVASQSVAATGAMGSSVTGGIPESPPGAAAAADLDFDSDEDENQREEEQLSTTIDLVDRYLRIVHGEESARYQLLRHAIDCHRVVFLFDSDSDDLSPQLEHILMGLALAHHRVCVAMRPSDSLTFFPTTRGSGVSGGQLLNKLQPEGEARV